MIAILLNGLPLRLIYDDIEPPTGTVAVVVDVRNSKGAVRIFEAETDEFLGGVGTEDQGNLMIIPWKDKWNGSCAGSLRLM